MGSLRMRAVLVLMVEMSTGKREEEISWFEKSMMAFSFLAAAVKDGSEKGNVEKKEKRMRSRKEGIRQREECREQRREQAAKMVWWRESPGGRKSSKGNRKPE